MNLGLLDSRKKLILKALISTTRPTKEQDLSKSLEVSLRTIKNDVSFLKSVLGDINIELISKPRVGIWIKADETATKNLKKELDSISKQNEFAYEQNDRHRYIIKKFLAEDGKITMQELADELYLSKATINLDIKFVEEWFEKHNLRLHKKTYHGMRIEGNEKDFRFAVASFLTNMIEMQVDLKNLCTADQENIIPSIEFFNDILINITKNDLSIIKDIINMFNVEKSINLSDSSYWELVLYLLIQEDRIRREKYVSFSNSDRYQLMKTEEYKKAIELSKNIEEKLKINFNEDEVCYIALHLLGLKENVYLIANDEHIDDYVFDNEIKSVIHKVIIYIKDKFGIDLNNDKQLALGLGIHLVAAINRLRYGASVHNPMIDEIKRNYLYAFNIAVEISEIIKDNFKISMVEDEIGFITLHLQAAIDRNNYMHNEKIRAYVACNTGIGVAQLISMQLRKKFPKIDVKKLVSVSGLIQELNDIEYRNNVDLVISTIPIKELSVPVVRVSPFISAAETEAIENQLSIISDNKSQLEKRGKFNTLKAYTRKILIFMDMWFKDRKELITYVSGKLCEEGFVTQEFGQSVFAREAMASTYIGHNIAMPHGYSEYVNKPIISIVALKNPIDWEGKKVQLAFVCALDLSLTEVAEKLFEELYEIANNKDLLKKVKQASNIKMLSEILGWTDS